MTATRLFAVRWIVAAATAVAVSVGASAAARATESADDTPSIRDQAVAGSTEAGPAPAAPVPAARPSRAAAGKIRPGADGASAGAVASASPIPDRDKLMAPEVTEKVLQEINGVASWYGPGFHGRRTANGERFDQNDLTAAHKTLPFNTRVRVTSALTGKSVIVKINDRGPYIRGRMIDLSAAAASAIGLRGRGVGKVKLEVLETPVDTAHEVGSRATATREGTAGPRRVTTIIAAE